MLGDVAFTHYPLSGTVIDALRNIPIKEATITLVGADGQVKTDEEGNFRITLSETCYAKDTLHLQITAPHYEAKDIFIPNNTDLNQKIVIYYKCLNLIISKHNVAIQQYNNTAI